MKPSRSKRTDLEIITDIYFNASLLNYEEELIKWRKVQKKPAALRKHAIGKNTDLRLSYNRSG